MSLMAASLEISRLMQLRWLYRSPVGVMSTLELFNPPHIHLELVEGRVPHDTEIAAKVAEAARFELEQHIVDPGVEIHLGVLETAFLQVKHENEILLVEQNKEAVIDKSHLVHEELVDVVLFALKIQFFERIQSLGQADIWSSGVRFVFLRDLIVTVVEGFVLLIAIAFVSPLIWLLSAIVSSKIVRLVVISVVAKIAIVKLILLISSVVVSTSPITVPSSSISSLRCVFGRVVVSMPVMAATLIVIVVLAISPGSSLFLGIILYNRGIVRESTAVAVSAVSFHEKPTWR